MDEWPADDVLTIFFPSEYETQSNNQVIQGNYRPKQSDMDRPACQGQKI